MKRLNLAGVVVVIAWAMFAPCADAQLSSHNLVNYLYDLQVCTGQYALCAAAICTPVPSGTIDVNTATGPVSFPEASCTCPVYYGPAIADPNGGNMQGSCAPPGRNQIWSLYWPKSNMPQQINNWSLRPSKTEAPFQLCSSTENVGDTFANCFSFACTLDAQRHNGVKTATCLCPLGEDPNGSAVPAATAVVTPAGQCDSDVCAEHPVGAAFPGLNADGNACLGSNSNSVGLILPGN
jgi:hypothetical protein